MRSLVALLVAVNPPAVALALSARERRTMIAVAAAIAAAVAAALAGASEVVLDALDVSAATFRVATGLVLGLAALRWLALGTRSFGDYAPGPLGWRRVVAPLLVPTLVTPQLVAVSISVGADDGVALAAVGAAAAMALAWVAATIRTTRNPAWSAGVRFIGMIGVVVALALAVDGVKSV